MGGLSSGQAIAFDQGANYDAYDTLEFDQALWFDSVTYRVLDGKMIVDIRIRTDFLNGYVKFKEDQEEYEAWQKGSWYWYMWTKKKYGE